MKWLYPGLGLIGVLAPIGIIYAANYDRRVPGAVIDLGLLFFSAGVGIIFIPIGAGLGLILAAVVQTICKKMSAGTIPRKPWRQPHSPSVEGPPVTSEPEEG